MSQPFPFRPRLLDVLKNYSRQDFAVDLGAGATVGIVALSLAMALGIASNSTPAAGIYTAIVAGFLISALGGSKVQIGGPTAAFIPVVVSVSVAYGTANLILCTMLAGLILIGMGAARMGNMIKFIPFPVTAGFTAGIAVVIFSTQVKDFLGLQMDKSPGEFIERMKLLAEHLGTANWKNILLAAGSLALIRFWPAKLGRRLPASIVAVILGTAAVALFGLEVATIGSRYGVDAIPQSLPMPQLPEFKFDELGNLIRPALTIAVLGAIESLLCAVVADGMIDDRHDSNTELMAQRGRQHRERLFRRSARHRRHCPNGDKHSQRRSFARRRDCPCVDPARCHSYCGAVGSIHPSRHAERSAGERRIEHG